MLFTLRVCFHRKTVQCNLNDPIVSILFAYMRATFINQKTDLLQPLLGRSLQIKSSHDILDNILLQLIQYWLLIKRGIMEINK